MADRDGEQGGTRELAACSSLLLLAGGAGLSRETLRAGVEGMTVAVNRLLDDASDANEENAELVFGASFGKDTKAGARHRSPGANPSTANSRSARAPRSASTRTNSPFTCGLER